MTAAEEVLRRQLQRLQLHWILQHYPALAEQAARESWTHGRFLEHLIAGEAARRDEALVRRRVKAARLPSIKTLDGFDWSWPKKINRAQIQQLFRLDFLPQHGNVVLLGGVGVGKTHLAIALAHTACLQGHTTLFASAVDIVNTLAAAQATGGIKRELARLLKPKLLVVDDSAICRSTSSAPMPCSRSSVNATSAAPPSLPPIAPSSSGRRSSTTTAP